MGAHCTVLTTGGLAGYDALGPAEPSPDDLAFGMVRTALFRLAAQLEAARPGRDRKPPIPV